MKYLFSIAFVFAFQVISFAEEAAPAQPANPFLDRQLEGELLFANDYRMNGKYAINFSREDETVTLSRGSDTFDFVSDKTEDAESEEMTFRFADIVSLEITARDENDPYNLTRGIVTLLDGVQYEGELKNFRVTRITLTREDGTAVPITRARLQTLIGFSLWPKPEELLGNLEGELAPRTSLAPGDAIPFFEIESINNGLVSIEKILESKRGVCMIFATEESNTDNAPLIDKLSKDYSRHSAVIVIRRTIPFGPLGTLTLRGMNLSYPIIWDRRLDIWRKFGVTEAPCVIYSNAEGEITTVGPRWGDRNGIPYIADRLGRLYGYAEGQTPLYDPSEDEGTEEEWRARLAEERGRSENDGAENEGQDSEDEEGF
ncbi:MAG: hypothetical protein NUW37_03825 [Planctomycetes bacterium]|nr:hypothetical protein [Planctomycetota bacterium]